MPKSPPAPRELTKEEIVAGQVYWSIDASWESESYNPDPYRRLTRWPHRVVCTKDAADACYTVVDPELSGSKERIGDVWYKDGGRHTHNVGSLYRTEEEATEAYLDEVQLETESNIQRAMDGVRRYAKLRLYGLLSRAKAAVPEDSPIRRELEVELAQIACDLP